MSQVTDLSFDASRSSWQDFVKTLTRIRAASERASVFAQLQPPANCASEARRVIRDMGLADCVELIEPATGMSAEPLAGREQDGMTSPARTLLSRLRFAARPSAFRR